MKSIHIINHLISTLRLREAELNTILAESDSHYVQYIRALNAKYDNETEELTPILTDKDFNPIQMPWPSCLETVWGNKTEKDRAPNSLPRFSGHISVPTKSATYANTVLKEINALKLGIANEAKELHTHHQYSRGKGFRITDTLQQLEVLNSSENYQMTIRPLLFTDITQVISNVTISWLKNPISSDFRGDIDKARTAFTARHHETLLASLELHASQSPGCVFIRRYHSPPTICGRIKIDDAWNSRPFAISTPFIILNHTDETVYKTKLDRLEVVMRQGNIRSVEALRMIESGKGKRAKLTPIPDLVNWYIIMQD